MRMLLACLVLTVAAEAAPLVLVREGRSDYSICMARDASPSERRGAGELQRYLEEISGARLPLIADDTMPRGGLVLVGNSRIGSRLKLVAPDAVGSEGFVLKTAGRHLLIAGGRRRGTLYGVYTFLEKLGCRWFTRDVTRIPRRRTIEIGPMDEVQKPAFEYREPYFTEAFDGDWAVHNKVNGNFMQLDESAGGKVQYYPFVHSFYQLLPPERYFREHPEYFALIDGQRRVERGQLCLSNPDVLRLGVQAVLRWIGQHPEATIFSVSQNDWEGWCECDNCKRIEAEEGGAHSGPILRFVNAIAAEVEKQHPDKLIDTLAYWYSEPPPLRVRPRPNVRIRLCPIGACETHPYERCPYNAYFMKNLRAWAKITSQLYIWHYNTNFSHYLLPFPDFDELAADIPMYRRHGVVGLFLEGAYPSGGGGESAELRSYVMARLLWDTNADVQAAVREFTEGVYGRAATPMRAYFDLLQKEVRTPPAGAGRHMWIYGVPDFSAGFLVRARGLFQQAEAAADDETVRARVLKARLPVEYLELLQSKAFSIRNGLYAPADLPALRDRFQGFLASLRRFGITSIHEGAGLAVDEREFTALRPCRVVTLENGSLRVDVAPGLAGRVLSLIEKRSGWNLLRSPSPGERGYPDVAGLGVFLYPDYHSRNRWDVAWRAEPDAPEFGLNLAGTCANGLKLRRSLRLEGAMLRTETIVENASAGPLGLTVVSRFEADPSDRYEDLALSFRAGDGTAVDRTLLAPEEQPSGSQAFTGGQCPAGEWRVVDRRTGRVLAARFESDQVERSNINWTAKAQKRVVLDLWSNTRTLAPGQRLQLQADYGVGER